MERKKDDRRKDEGVKVWDFLEEEDSLEALGVVLRRREKDFLFLGELLWGQEEEKVKH